MSKASVELHNVVELCKAAASAVVGGLVRLGPRPSGQGPAAILWDQQEIRLRAQLNSLTALITKLSATAVLNGLQDTKTQAAVAELARVTGNARIAIERIQKISSLLTTLARVLDLGLSILAMAAAPNVASGAAVVKAAKALAKDIADDTGDGEED